MGTITAYSPMNLAEVQKRAGYDNSAAVIGELSKRNDFLMDVPWYPSSHGAYHKYLQATRLGDGTFGKANGPVAVIASQAEEMTEPTKLYEGDSPVDDRLLIAATDPMKVRDSEDALNLEGLIQGWIDKLIYGNEITTPDGFKGFSRRRPKLATYCVGGGGTGSDLTSMYLFEFGPAGFYLAYPEGAGTPGMKNEDRGRNYIAAPTGTGNYWAWVRHYEIWAALVLRDERAMLRYANIESAGSSNIFSPTTFITLKNKLPSMGTNAVAYANRTLKAQIEADAYNKSNASYSISDIEGFGPVARVAGVPVRVMEGLLDTETAITA
jgi:hypothetical protein